MYCIHLPKCVSFHSSGMKILYVLCFGIFLLNCVKSHINYVFFFFNSFKQIIQHNLCVYLSSVSKVTLILLQRTAVDTLDSHPATATSSLVSQRLNYVLQRVCVLHLQAEH